MAQDEICKTWHNVLRGKVEEMINDQLAVHGSPGQIAVAGQVSFSCLKLGIPCRK